MVKRIVTMLVMLLLIGCLAMPVFAAHPVPDLSQNGSLTFIMELDSVPLDNGNLNLYKVGGIADDDGNYYFQLMDGRKLLLSEGINQILAEEMLTLAKASALTKLTAPIEDGKAAFADLPVGLYVVWQDTADATEGLFPIQPFLISVPLFRDGAYELDVLAKPKNAPETIPPETTAPPKPDETLPQTGQLNWPVPVLAISGAVLFILGWILFTKGKRMSHEK